jgi:hypothetical protein
MIDSNNQQADDLLNPSLVAAGQAIERGDYGRVVPGRGAPGPHGGGG